MNDTQKVVTRFAPSPTGWLHIGGVRTALYAYLFARQQGGTFILRIEDTDREREVPGSVGHIQESLKWLGIEWDFGPEKPGSFGSCIQSERLETYRAAAQTLVDKGLAYADPYSHEEVEAMRREAVADKRPFLIREHRPANPGVWDGTRPLRFRVPDIKRSRWHDEVYGDLEAGEEALDDFILIKSDGYPTYNLAHIVDDHAMGVTHIFRADEFISSTPRFLSLYEALEITPPKFVTLPPILRADKTKKLGKRDGAKDILKYRNEGYEPDALCNMLALTGWNPGTEKEIFTHEELLAAFSLGRIQTHGAVFDEAKLRWFNKEHLRLLPDEAYAKKLTDLLQSRGAEVPDYLDRAVSVLRARAETIGDAAALLAGDECAFFRPITTPGAELLLQNAKATKEEVAAHLAKVGELLTSVSENNWNAETIKTAVFPYATEVGRASVLWPMRVSLSGQEKSPDPFIIAGLIGKQETLSRIEEVLKTF